MIPRVCWLSLLLFLAVSFSWSRPLTVTQQGNLLLVNGTPTALTFARNCTNPAELSLYTSLGFNTVLVRIDSPGKVVLDRVQALVDAAQQEGLYLLIELVNGNWSAGQQASLTDPEYQENVAYYLDEVIPRFRDCPNLLGWVISTVEEGQLISDDIGKFGDFLKAKYGATDQLNVAWSHSDPSSGMIYRSKMPAFSMLSEETARKLSNPHHTVQKKVNADIAVYQKKIHARDTDFQHFLRTQYPTVAALNTKWGFQFAGWDVISIDTIVKRENAYTGSSPRSLLDLSRYYATVPRTLMDWWAAEILHRDPDHLLFAGAQYSYRTMISLPPSINGVLTECYPRLAEPDLDSHNPQAIDIARRGNRFIVLAGIQAKDTNPQRFSHYLYSGAIHGAAGICVDDWPALLASAVHADVTRIALRDFDTRHLLGRTPSPRAAIVYSPYPIGPALANRPLYGYLQGFLYPGPATLYFTFRKGTSYGQFDYLAPEDLPLVPLDKYRVILLPTVLDFPESAQRALRQFVSNGGTALADLGLGTIQANGNYHFLPPDMMKLFGVLNAPGLEDVRYNLEVYRPQPRFRRLLPGYRTTGVAGGYTVARAARAIPNGMTDLLFSVVKDSALERPQARVREVLERKPTTGVFITQVGRGTALYATLPLYHLWTPGSMLFEDFHRDLLGEHAEIALQRPIDFLPPFAEIANYADGSVVLWTKDQAVATADIRNPSRWAYQVDSGWCEVGINITVLRCTLPGVQLARPLPIAFNATAPTIKFAAKQVNSQGLLFDVEAVGEQQEPVEVYIGSGDYVIVPGSTHAVTIISGTGSRQVIVKADGQGWFTMKLHEAHCRILVTNPEAQVGVETPKAGNASQHGETPVDVVPDIKFQPD